MGDLRNKICKLLRLHCDECWLLYKLSAVALKLHTFCDDTAGDKRVNTDLAAPGSCWYPMPARHLFLSPLTCALLSALVRAGRLPSNERPGSITAGLASSHLAKRRQCCHGNKCSVLTRGKTNKVGLYTEQVAWIPGWMASRVSVFNPPPPTIKPCQCEAPRYSAGQVRDVFATSLANSPLFSVTFQQLLSSGLMSSEKPI